MHPLRRSLEAAVAELGGRLRLPLQLGGADAVALRFGDPPEDIVIEWVERGQCVAVHAAFVVPPEVDRKELAAALLRGHVAGLATLGCTFWALPDDSLRVGLTLVGPTLAGPELAESLARVSKAAGLPKRELP